MNLVIGFSRPKSKWKIFSLLTRLVEDTPFSHVFISWYSPSLDREIVYHASGLMVHFLEGSRFRETNKIVSEFSFELNEHTRTKIIQFAVDRAGAAYSLKQLIGLSLVAIARRLGIDLKNPIKTGRYSYVCCELAGELLNSIGYTIDQELDDMTPKDLYEIICRTKGDRCV